VHSLQRALEPSFVRIDSSDVRLVLTAPTHEAESAAWHLSLRRQVVRTPDRCRDVSCMDRFWGGDVDAEGIT